jgi:hypothetical protein
MNRPFTGIVSLCFCILACAASVYSQQPVNARAAAEPPPEKIEVIYTGKLLGYFRSPSLQPRNLTQCSDPSRGKDSEAATQFLQARVFHHEAILVGTGDNFAPQLEAREFAPPPSSSGSAAIPPPSPSSYQPMNKELYYADKTGKEWLPYGELPPDLAAFLAAGHGTIPMDNVACFLRAARFSAIVPGKHDFYFGPERVRELARLLAGGSQPVQMLGANLVQDTEPRSPKPLAPSDIEKPWFPLDWPSANLPLNLSEGQKVYPWLSYVKIKIVDLRADHKLTAEIKEHITSSGDPDKFSTFALGLKQSHVSEYDHDVKELQDSIGWVNQSHFYICISTGNPNEVSHPGGGGAECRQISQPEVRLAGDSVAYYFQVPPIEPNPSPTGRHFYSTLEPGKNYGLCRVEDGKKDVKNNRQVSYCLRFSTHVPFLTYPHKPSELNVDGYTDPSPFVLTKNDRAAIFGVVDTTLGEQVGSLNFAWKNTDARLKTSVSAEDPAEALREQLDYFECWTRRFKPEKFDGLKILLAQTTPQGARALATRFPEFQIVVSAADEDQATSEAEVITNWKSGPGSRSFVAVPAPAFDTLTREGKMHFSWLTAIASSPDKSSWYLASNSIPPNPICHPEEPLGPAPDLTKLRAEAVKGIKCVRSDPQLTNFWKAVSDALASCQSRLGPSNQQAQQTADHMTDLKRLVLCTMRQETGADVALIQKRDLFDQIPQATPDALDQYQMILDRLLWKGDFLTLMYVPGSAIKKALQKATDYDNDESNALLFASEKGRSFEKLGISSDPETKEYLINEVAIDDTKTYAVATTDYIGAGDTGYADLVGAALNPRTHPAAFPRTLQTISGLVCNQLFGPSGQGANQYCFGDVDRDKYVDKTSAARTTPYPRPDWWHRVWKLFPFKVPSDDSLPLASAAPLEKAFQHRPTWDFLLRNFSLGFTNLDNNLTDAEVDQKFSGISTSGVTAHQTHTLTVALDSRFSRALHRLEFYFAQGIDYKKQTTGVSNTTPLVNQISNRVTLEGGAIVSFPGRSLPHLGLVLNIHNETPLERPAATFALATQTIVDSVNNIKVTDRLTISQDRDWLFLPRVGVRLQSKSSTIEGGLQAGWDFKSLSGYRFDTQGTMDECRPTATESLADCIKRKSNPPGATITKDSIGTPILEDHRRAGVYLKTNLSIPFNSKITYQLDQEANFFFVSFHTDNPVDTWLLDKSKHRLLFNVFPSLSIGPSLELLFYKNKVNRDLLRQSQFGFETTFSFDLFNRREPGVQIKHKP